MLDCKKDEETQRRYDFIHKLFDEIDFEAFTFAIHCENYFYYYMIPYMVYKVVEKVEGYLKNEKVQPELREAYKKALDKKALQIVNYCIEFKENKIKALGLMVKMVKQVDKWMNSKDNRTANAIFCLGTRNYTLGDAFYTVMLHRLFSDSITFRWEVLTRPKLAEYWRMINDRGSTKISNVKQEKILPQTLCNYNTTIYLVTIYLIINAILYSILAAITEQANIADTPLLIYVILFTSLLFAGTFCYLRNIRNKVIMWAKQHIAQNKLDIEGK